MEYKHNLLQAEFPRKTIPSDEELSEDSASTSPGEKITKLIRIKNDFITENSKYINQSEKEKINQLANYKKDFEIKSDVLRIIDELYHSKTVNCSSIEQYSFHVNRLMTNKNQSTVVEHLLDNLTGLIKREIQLIHDKLFSNLLVMESFEKLKNNFVDKGDLREIKGLLQFINRLKNNLKNFAKNTEEVFNRFYKVANDLDSVFNPKKSFNLELPKYIEEEIQNFICIECSDLKLLLSYLRFYCLHCSLSKKETIIFGENEVQTIESLNKLVEQRKEDKNRVSVKEEILTQIKLKNNQFNEVKDIDQIVKYIENTTSSKRKKGKKKSKKSKAKTKVTETAVEKESSDDDEVVQFYSKLKGYSKHSKEVIKIKPAYSLSFLTQLKELCEQSM